MRLAVISVSVNYVRSEKPSEMIIEKRLCEVGEENRAEKMDQNFRKFCGSRWGSSRAFSPMANALTSTAILIPQPPAALAVIMPAPPPLNKASRKKNGYSPPKTSSNELARSNKKAGAQSPAFPLVAFFWPARKSTSQWLILPLVLMFVGLFRWCAGLWAYSGTDPLFHCDSLPYLC